MTQLELPLISREYDGEIIQQRAVDGYINATAMGKAVGKKIYDYDRLATTKEFLAELSSETGIPVSELVITIKRGASDLQETWVHPDVAIHLGQWLSPKFAVRVAKWVREWISGNIKTSLPYHIERYLANRSQIPHTYFSILNELTLGLIAPLESAGYRLPENMMPDISEGKMFCRWLREEKGIDTDTLPTYEHKFQDGRVVRAKLYPNGLLAAFRKHLNEVWIPKKSVSYFEERDAKALEYLRKTFKLKATPKKALSEN